jgi:dTMP kinase
VARGVFVTYEGIEGAGKSTQIALVAARLHARGVPSLVTREPGGTPLGAALRALLLERRGGPVAPLVEALLMVADRADHVGRVLRPALAGGQVVLCDRHADATLAYQGGGSGLPLDLLRELNRVATGGLVPDLTVFLDLAPERAAERLAARGQTVRDRFESEPTAFFERVRACYLELAAAEPGRWLVLAAGRPPEELAAAAEDAIRRRLPPELQRT